MSGVLRELELHTVSLLSSAEGRRPFRLGFIPDMTDRKDRCPGFSPSGRAGMGSPEVQAVPLFLHRASEPSPSCQRPVLILPGNKRAVCGLLGLQHLSMQIYPSSLLPLQCSPCSANALEILRFTQKSEACAGPDLCALRVTLNMHVLRTYII